MSARPLSLLVGLAMQDRKSQIEDWIRDNPEKVKRLPSVKSDTVPAVAEQFDRVQIGTTWGAYRRRKHGGSDEQ